MPLSTTPSVRVVLVFIPAEAAETLPLFTAGLDRA
jgi:hypothetical protein